ncbi:hypothetical protein Dred_2025 [Desulforamulus reducens MI-1]|uniref:Uncharacterized protein n=1 Tax=Desulforamulus reducens (strain ATCC BAA-1160 / DSM 100696 / MI-1) TaxID=349161 RepID=A4J639_DESRM|nr:hypothetical protein [Desulforamulus reducens]ABO50542.1 hypothetical protein Dred_2025 [Desulforamulus reducens MI-1]
MASQPVPSSQNQHIMILIEEYLTVETYLQLFSDGCPEKFRPRVCPHCLIQVMLHRHGTYYRYAYTPEGQSHIPIYRFICLSRDSWRLYAFMALPEEAFICGGGKLNSSHKTCP